MKNRILSLILALFMVCSFCTVFVLSVSAEEEYYFWDLAALTSAKDESDIDAMLREVSKKYDCPVIIVTINGESYSSYEKFAIDVANDYDEEYNKAIVLILALIPSLFGIMGMAQIYQGRARKGLKFLSIGLPLFLLMCLCGYGVFNGGWPAIFLVGFFFIIGCAFMITYLIQAFDAYSRTIFSF